MDDPATLQRKWDQARMRLDTGMSLRQIVATADADTLAAIKEWAPTWIDVQAQARQPSSPQGVGPGTARTLEQLINSIDERLLVIGDDGTREAIEADREARSAVAVFEQHAAHIGRLVAGTRPARLGPLWLRLRPGRRWAQGSRPCRPQAGRRSKRLATRPWHDERG